jgi:hypothetical protein
MTNRHQRAVLKIVLGTWVGSAAGNLSPAFQQGCTLKPMDGSKRSVLPGGANGKMTWSACTRIVHDFVFEWPRNRLKAGASTGARPQSALKNAASLLREWRKATKTGSSPFGDLVEAHRQTTAQASPYVLGEQFAVTDTPGWDGAWVSLSTTTQVAQPTIHYWVTTGPSVAEASFESEKKAGRKVSG